MLRKFGCWAALFAVMAISGCSVEEDGDGGTTSTGPGGTEGNTSTAALEGKVQIDGSSTVFPISQAVAEEFMTANEGVQVTVGTSGTGGGFKKFIAGETDINDASRPIKDSEAEKLKEAGIEFLELKVAIDGLSVIVNPENDFVDSLSTDQLEAIWEPDSKVSKWSDVNPAWPGEDIKLYGPDTDSGTFDYFTDEICGEEGKCRADYTPSADDNVLVRGVAGDKFSLGYFGYAYYLENKDKLKIVGVADGADADPVVPDSSTIKSGKYTPLSRPLFIYVRVDALKEKPEVKAFLDYYLSDEGQELAKGVGYIPLDSETLEATRKQVADATAE